MPTLKYLLEQAARCRRLAAHVLDKDMRKRLPELADEYERKAAALLKSDPDSRPQSAGDRPPADLSAERLRSLATRAPHIAKDLFRIAAALESAAAES